MNEGGLMQLESKQASSEKAHASNSENARVIGYALAIAQAILYSTMGVACKFLYGTGLSTGQVVSLRYFGTALVLGALLLIWRKYPLFSRRPIVYVQGFFFVLCTILYYLSVRELTANVATVLFYAYPPMVALMAAIVFKERPSARTIVALAISMFGIILLSGIIAGILGTENIAFSPLGVVYGIGSCVAFAIYNIIGQMAVGKKDGPLTMTFSMCVVGVVMCVIAYPADIPTLISVSPTQLGVALFMVVFNTIIPVVMLLEAIKRIGATITSLIGISETPFAVMFAFVILGETLTGMQVAGSILVVLSILMVTLPSKKAKGSNDGAPDGSSSVAGGAHDSSHDLADTKDCEGERAAFASKDEA